MTYLLSASEVRDSYWLKSLADMGHMVKQGSQQAALENPTCPVEADWIAPEVGINGLHHRFSLFTVAQQMQGNGEADAVLEIRYKPGCSAPKQGKVDGDVGLPTMSAQQ